MVGLSAIFKNMLLGNCRARGVPSTRPANIGQSETKSSSQSQFTTRPRRSQARDLSAIFGTLIRPIYHNITMHLPRIKSSHHLSPNSATLLLALHRLTIASSLPSNHRSASHASEGRANRAQRGPGKRLGAKKSDSELVVPGNIIFRQRGTHWFPGEGCGMGRDHTIFALQKGFVRYYRDPERDGIKVRGDGEHVGRGGRGETGGKGRRYIGIVFRQEWSLPRGRGEVRRRRLGMEMSTMAEPPPAMASEIGQQETVDGNTVASQASSLPRAVTTPTISAASPPVIFRSNHTHIESNYSIGRAAERAGVKVRVYNPKDRFLAWRKSNARKARNAERRGLRRKGK